MSFFDFTDNTSIYESDISEESEISLLDQNNFKERKRVISQNHRNRSKFEFNCLENEINNEEIEIFESYEELNNLLQFANNIDNCNTSPFECFNF